MRERSAFRVISEQASAQAGCVSRRALLADGVPRGVIQRLVDREALVPAARGIYGYGIVALDAHALRWAAVLLGGQGARLGHRSALEAHRVLPASVNEATVVIPRRGGAGVRRIRTMLPTPEGRRATIAIVPTTRPGAAAMVRGIWADTILRAIDDMAGRGHHRELRKAWREADYLGLLDHALVRQHLAVASPGAGAIRDLLREIPLVGAEEELFSRGERRILEALVQAELPAPLVNGSVEFGGIVLRPDLWFVDAQLVVEIDGGGHTRPARAASDRARDDHLRRQGAEVLRFTDADARRRPDACVQVIADCLQQRAQA